MKHISLALIGAGGIGKRWANAIREVPSVELKAIVDVDTTKASTLAFLFFGCAIFESVEDMLQNVSVEATIVATPHHLLAPLSLSLIQAGKHVLSEKPGAIRADQLEAVVKEAREKDVRYMLGFNHRFHEGFIKAREVVDSGRIGKIQFIRSIYGFGGRQGFEKEWRHNRAVSGGGELIDQGVHMIDMVHSFIGPCARVHGVFDSLFWNTEVEDNACVLMHNDQKQMASIHVSWSQWKPMHRFEIYGDMGYIVVEGLGRKYGGSERVIVGKRGDDFGVAIEEEIVCDPNADMSLVRELEEFCRAIEEKRDPVPSGRDGVEVLRVVERVYQESKIS